MTAPVRDESGRTTPLGRALSGVGTAGATGRRKVPRRRARGTFTMSAMVMPSVVLLLLINAYPLVYAGFQSVHDGSLLVTGPFVGTDNYQQVLTDPVFWRAARFTLIFTLAGVFGSWLIGLALALLLQTPLPGKGVFKILLMLPWVAPVVVTAMSWNFLVATPDSPVPAILTALGIESPLFLADPFWAALVVCLFKVWGSFPFMMLMSNAALASVDGSVYEAAKMDGAGAWQRLRHMTLPLTARSTYISWILMTIFCVNDFPTVYLLTGGGPVNATSTLVVLSYQTVFANFQTGPGVAMAFLMTVVLVVVSVVLFRQIRKSSTL